MGSFKDFNIAGNSGGPNNGNYSSQIAARQGQQQFLAPKYQSAPTPSTQISGQPVPTQAGPGMMTAYSSGGGDPYAPQNLGGNWWSGRTKSYSTSAPDYQDLRGGLQGYLINQLNNMGPTRGPDDPTAVNGYQPVSFSGFGAGPTTQSLDQLMGGNSAFFNNIVNSLNPVFAQRRAAALAQAKEGAGNLTGSGFGNILGNRVNQSLGEETAQLLDYGTRGAQMEQARQAADADRTQARDIRGGELGLQADEANQAAFQHQGDLDQQRLIEIFKTRAGLADADAQRLAQLLQSAGTVGVGPREIAQSGGVGGVLSGVLDLAGKFIKPRI